MVDVKISSGVGNYATGVVPMMPNGGGHANVTSNAVGVFYSTLANASCRQVTVANNSNTTVEVRQDGIDFGFPVFVQTYYTFYGLQYVSQLAIRRTDQSNTQVVINYRYEG